MSKRGKTPSLIGGGAGPLKQVVAKRKRPCSRCEKGITKSSKCWEVKKGGGFGSGRRTYCVQCFKKVLEQSQKDLQHLEEQVS